MQSNFQQRLYGFGYKFSNLLSRKIIFLCLLFCMLLYYLAPYMFTRIRVSFSYASNAGECGKRHLLQHDNSIGEFDTVIDHLPFEATESKTSPHLPFVGNGKLGAIVKYDDPQLFMFYEDPNILNKRPETSSKIAELPFNTLLKPDHISESLNKDESVVLSFRHGILEKLSCLSLSTFTGGCIFINHTVLAHRSRPNVFLQHLEGRIEGGDANHQGEDVVLNKFDFASLLGFKEIATKNQRLFRLYGGSVEAGNGYIPIVFSISNSPNIMHVTNSPSHIDVVTVIMHSSVVSKQTKIQRSVDILSEQVSKYTEEIMQLSIDELIQEHRDAWSDILHTGLSISTAYEEPNIPVPWVVNATLYYVLSTMDSKLHDKDLPEAERRDLMKRLQTPDFCYRDHSTVHARNLWSPVTSAYKVLELARLWLLLLNKRGCKNLISEGAEGMLQAMVLSFGGMQFTEEDLRLQMDPDILHNEISFHRVLYKNNTLDVSIVDKSGSPNIALSLIKAAKEPLYACEAGCQGTIVQVRDHTVDLEVFVTDPITPILYISHDKKHLSLLKHTLHLNSIMGHAQHMATKRQSTGLPVLFWVGIGTLVVLFHIFLVRLILKEYYAPSTLTSLPTNNKHYYSNRGRLAS